MKRSIAICTSYTIMKTPTFVVPHNLNPAANRECSYSNSIQTFDLVNYSFLKGGSTKAGEEVLNRGVISRICTSSRAVWIPRVDNHSSTVFCVKYFSSVWCSSCRSKLIMASKIKLKSSDDKVVEVDRGVAMISSVIRGMMENCFEPEPSSSGGAAAEEQIPLQVRGAALETAMAFAEFQMVRLDAFVCN